MARVMAEVPRENHTDSRCGPVDRMRRNGSLLWEHPDHSPSLTEKAAGQP